MRKTAPIRMCVGCGERDNQARLLRFSYGREGSLVLGPGNGRGGYLHPRRTCLQTFTNARPGFVRSIRATVPKDMRARFIVDIERNATLFS